MSEKYQALRQTLSSFHYDDDDGLPLRASVVRDLLADHDRLQAQVEGLRAELASWHNIHEEIHRRADKECCLEDECDFIVTICHDDYAAIDSARAGREDGNG